MQAQRDKEMPLSKFLMMTIYPTITEQSPNFTEKKSLMKGKICLNPCQKGDARLIGAACLSHFCPMP